MKTKFVFLFVIGALMSAGALPLHAVMSTTAPAVKSDNRLPLSGVISQVDLKAMTIKIGNSTFALTATTYIHTSGGERLIPDNLKKGTHVRFNPSEGTPHSILTEIEVLSGQ